MITTARYARRWRLPPPYLREAEPLEGARILEEISGPLGLLLWQSVRDAGLWALTPADRREGLFTQEAEPRRLADLLSMGEAARAIEEPLRALAAMLSHPADVAPEAVMLACNRVSQWAESRNAIATALAYAQGSALAMPASSRSALRVGQLARRQAEYARAEGWLQRAIVLARQETDRVSHASGYSALGNLYRMRGNMPAAERHHLRALRIADRHSLAGRAAAALHDLFVICADTGRVDQAVGYARRAVSAYGAKHEQVPALAHDVALMWLETGEFARALPVLHTIWPFMPAHQRVLGLANAARAAGALGERQMFTACHERVLRIVDAAEVRENHAVALLNVARGAVSLGELELAETLGARAQALADSLQEHKIRFSAGNLLQSIAAERGALRSIAPEQGTPVTTAAGESADALADELVACFSGLRPQVPEPA
jgi:tetratricopeptide (TPR) repeat protein